MNEEYEKKRVQDIGQNHWNDEVGISIDKENQEEEVY